MSYRKASDENNSELSYASSPDLVPRRSLGYFVVLRCYIAMQEKRMMLFFVLRCYVATLGNEEMTMLFFMLCCYVAMLGNGRTMLSF